MQFLNPIWLWALSALAIPIAIHLLSRKEGKVISLGSIRFLTETPTAQFRHIKLNEILLLILRSLLVCWLVFLLAGLHLPSLENRKKSWLLIEPGLQLTPRWQQMIDSLTAKDFEIHALSPSFPKVEAHTTTPDTLAINYWSLVKQLEKYDLDTAIVLASGKQKFFKGKREFIPNNLLFIQAGEDDETEKSKFVSISQDKVWETGIVSKSSQTIFYNKILSTAQLPDSIQVNQRDTIHITIVNDKSFKKDVDVLSASLRTIQTVTPHLLKIKNQTYQEWEETKTDFLFWFGKNTPSTTATVVKYSSCQITPDLMLMEAPLAGHQCDSVNADYVITQRLNVDNVLSTKFTQQLATLILSKRFNDIDETVTPISARWSQKEKSNNKFKLELSTEKTSQLLVILMMITLIAERMVSLIRQQ